ncbi:MAG: PRC-barrel domain-containing protein [Betaproteobacteria bacterium]
MLQRAMRDIKGDALVARDGEIGSVKDVYFDDECWAVRYLVVDTGKWLPGREVLISPASIGRKPSGEHQIAVDLTREQVERSPSSDEQPPASRLYEEAHARYYGYPYYWTGPYPAGIPSPVQGIAGPVTERKEAEQMDLVKRRAEESRLRSGAEVVGYHISAEDGDIGHVEDFIIDDANWAVCDVVVDTRNWLPGRKVKIPPSAIQYVDWSDKEVVVSLTRRQIEQAPDAT